MFWAVVLATVFALTVTVNENLLSAIGFTFRAAQIGALGLFRIVIQRMPELVDEAIVEMEAVAFEQAFDIGKGDGEQVIHDPKCLRAFGLGVIDAVYLEQQDGGRPRLVWVRVECLELDFAFHEQTIRMMLHIANAVPKDPFGQAGLP